MRPFSCADCRPLRLLYRDYPMTGAIADCERILQGFWGQPANSVTTVAFVIGAVLVLRSGLVWPGWALAATGIGSFVFHGPMPPGAEWAHDVTLAWLLVVAGAHRSRWERWSTWPALAVIGALLALVPDAAKPLAVVAAAAAIVAILRRFPTPSTWGALALLGVGAAVGRLSASGGPWCNPDTLLQGHAFWHLTAAAATTWWFLSAKRRVWHTVS